MRWLSIMLNKLTHPIRVLFSSPMALLSAPKKMLGMTLPVRVGVVFLVVLLATVFAVWATEVWKPNEAVQVLIILGFVVALPLVSMQVVKLWLIQEPAKHPRVDSAWEAGLAALAEKHLDVTSLPLFLVMGAKDDAQARSLMEASEKSVDVGVPGGGAAFQWHIAEDAIYVVCTKISRVSCLSAMFSRGETAEPVRAPVPRSPEEKSIFEQTMDPNAAAVSSPGFDQTGQMFGDDEDSVDFAPADFGRTINPGNPMDSGVIRPSQVGASGRAGVARIGQKDASRISSELSYLCDLLRTHRQPFCPVNGIISFIPIEMVATTDDQSAEIQMAIREDCRLLAEGLKIRAPLITLVGGLEKYSGFRELVRRVGKEQAKSGRFGKGYPVWCPPDSEQIEALTRHACGQFEDWAYSLFRRDKELTNHGNPKLYSLLCLIRGDVTRRLIDINIAGYARDAKDQSMLYSGCYFAATGDRPDRQAFVRSVFEKLDDQVDELDWHTDIRRANDRHESMRNVLMVLNVILLLVVLGICFSLGGNGS